MKKELIKGLSKEQIARVKECKNHDELLKLAAEEGVQLTEEQLNAISGGGICNSSNFKLTCPKCGSQDYEIWEVINKGKSDEYFRVHCNNCLHNWYHI